MPWYQYRSGRAFINTECGFYSHRIHEVVITFYHPLRKDKDGTIIHEAKDIPLHKYKAMIASGRITELKEENNPWLQPDGQLNLF